ncbi:tRNA uridine-5-carboxymethylaminomethyl(34) synthesis GTPase MnmE [Mesobaculum littorinae]|uniref:tRNA modification GTPase MnmE n=1 Tax=Mesobaculum littorinae TaxID=2486419 RepID=A0A438AH70_9RHOB|nr:tRNA uridine-5-carboxymethylaminomethyl(34) synthesis GTPase MnmE [Mesobaculum littorinae]RVV98018.1 tRNA uridine-5-carboxymethylaminomethyl(34) synthesis GTPase MnmE [Mesobaculum littorinae]
MDTIFALATAHGRAGVAVIRVSGPAAFAAAEHLAGPLPAPRVASHRRLRNEEGQTLDEGLVLCFPEGQSFTGESTVELQIHGSIAAVSAVQAALSRQPGLRLAEPGEFTRRALANNRMDLTQVEALGDLIDAETEVQRKLAQDVLAGGLRRQALSWRDRLIEALGLIEATIEFSEEDIPQDLRDRLLDRLTGIAGDMRQEADTSIARERVRQGFEVAILGRPNAGKSTLLNRLAGREAAITSQIAGTTRDVIEVRMDLDGMAVTLLDTAGLRETEDTVERLGIAAARSRAERADLRIFLKDSLQDTVEDTLFRDGDIIAVGKSDLTGDAGAISGLTGQGIPELLDELAKVLRARVPATAGASHGRQRIALTSGVAHLDRAISMLSCAGEDEIVSDEIRLAARALDLLMGKVDVEDVLDSIFSSFCIGK